MKKTILKAVDGSPPGMRLVLRPAVGVMSSMPVELASELAVLPICKIGGCIVLLTGAVLDEEAVARAEEALGLPVYTLPAEIVDLHELLTQPLKTSQRFRQYVQQLAELGHFLEDHSPRQSDQPAGPPSLRDLLAELGLASESELVEATDVDGTIDAALFIDSSVLRLIPAEVASEHSVLPLKRSGQELTLAVASQLENDALEELQQVARLDIKQMQILSPDLQPALERAYRRVNQLGFQQMRLGEILLARGVVSRAQLDSGLEKQARSGQKLGEILVAKGYATEEVIYSALADKLGYEYQPFNYLEVDREASAVVSKRFAESHQVLPAKLDAATSELVVAMANPHDLAVLDLLKKLCKQRGYELRTVISTPSQIQQGIAYVYNTRSISGDELEIETVVTEENERTDLVLNSEMPQIKKILNQLLYQAVVDGASDIHIENLESRVRVRFRIDGILQLRETAISKENIGQVISVLKIDSGLDITERRRPQDGVFKKRIGKDWYIDFRINVHCTAFGADAVIRILDSSKKLPKLDQLGLPDDILNRFLKLVQNPQGLILITGPTGSGKSTTLYSTLSFLNRGERKIVTAEDPIEYHLDGICQYQVNDQIGNTFAEYGRRFLRKDPDIILIGEARDETTAESCMRAAMTGHMVFSTLHTNHSTAAIARLLDLGVDSSSVSDALLAVVAQRLVRKTCEGCRERYEPPAEIIQEFFGDRRPDFDFVRGRGCASCHHTGYRGRIGVYEFWELNRDTRYAILSGISERELQQRARQSGLRPLVADALNKVSQGITTLDELLRVVPLEQIRTHAMEQIEQEEAKATLTQPARFAI